MLFYTVILDIIDECFTDVDWAGSKEDMRSISGYCVCWRESSFMEG